MIKIFNPRYQIDVCADWLGYDNTEFVGTQDINEALSQEIKIAAVPYLFDEFDAYKQSPFDYSQFDLLLISDVEYNHPSPVQQWIEKLNIKNYLFALGAPAENAPSEWIYRPWWSFNIAAKNTFQEITAQNPLYEFDVLLGATRPHRNFVMAKLQKSDLLDKSIVTYREVFNVVPRTELDHRDTAILEEIPKILDNDTLLFPYISPNLNLDWEVRDNITNNVSDIVPWKIFEHTKYSVLCETKHRELFLTEKLGKALFAKRFFVVFSTSHYLKKLKELGFKTFDNVIDESYDAEEDHVKRFHMAFDQLTSLAKQDYNTVLDRTKDAREHNHNHLLKYKEEIKHTMRQMVYNKLKEIKC